MLDDSCVLQCMLPSHEGGCLHTRTQAAQCRVLLLFNLRAYAPMAHVVMTPSHPLLSRRLWAGAGWCSGALAGSMACSWGCRRRRASSRRSRRRARRSRRHSMRCLLGGAMGRAWQRLQRARYLLQQAHLAALLTAGQTVATMALCHRAGSRQSVVIQLG